MATSSPSINASSASIQLQSIPDLLPELIYGIAEDASALDYELEKISTKIKNLSHNISFNKITSTSSRAPRFSETLTRYDHELGEFVTKFESVSNMLAGEAIPETLHSFRVDSEAAKLAPGLEALFNIAKRKFDETNSKRLETLTKTSETVQELFTTLGGASASISLTGSILKSFNLGSLSASFRSINSISSFTSAAGTTSGLEESPVFCELQKRMTDLTQKLNLTAPSSSSSSSSPSTVIPLGPPPPPVSRYSMPTPVVTVTPPPSTKTQPLPVLHSSMFDTTTPEEEQLNTETTEEQPIEATDPVLPSSLFNPTTVEEEQLNTETTEEQPIEATDPLSLSVILNQFTDLQTKTQQPITPELLPAPTEESSEIPSTETSSSSFASTASSIETPAAPSALENFKEQLKQSIETYEKGLSKAKKTRHSESQSKKLERAYTKSILENFGLLPTELRKKFHQAYILKHKMNPKKRADHVWSKGHFCKYENRLALTRVLKSIE
ncbi:MAG: hypothetical protein K2P51_04755 [Rhabdochlamydiaceae bacterium]|nr:hypothetical protein [Rhabdochlamydiaceae bacterium]